MAQVTKQQLLDEVEQLRAECDRLRTENMALRSQRAPTTDRRALLAAAKEQAMRTGRVAKV